MTKRIVGIDFGLARIGIAVSDPFQLIASPLMTIKAEKKMEKTVEEVAKALQKDQQNRKYEIEKIIVGLPLLMSGKRGMMADEVSLFVELLAKTLDLPVQTWDERLTSVQAERTLREGEMSRKKRTKIIDQVSAVIILQNYLDHKGLRGLDEPLSRL